MDDNQQSIEDDGAGISYDVYIPNVQDDVIIDYATGESRLEEGRRVKCCNKRTAIRPEHQ